MGVREGRGRREEPERVEDHSDPRTDDQKTLVDHRGVDGDVRQRKGKRDGES